MEKIEFEMNNALIILLSVPFGPGFLFLLNEKKPHF